ncbi:hypothetical protein MON38_14555 [Hymenobacter sp. DH14]|uniref:DUF4239 domain-containing protein n=1 Tax=Hymenobacter cyanobacteriorum TaxID=2926463 RepID=A0A9X1VKE9_9BACT|nr:hypothetical protein [Hymenobacter cyanobacteriorum]MCI1188645.1 hypothetical protein [Hymenobacter cyanobacteriorum]
MMPFADRLDLPGPPAGTLLGSAPFGDLSREMMREYSLLYRTDSRLLVLLLFGLLLLFTWAGLWEGRRRRPYAAGTTEQSVAVASLLALQGLLLAFSFSMASDRFQARRDALVALAASFRTTVLRANLYPEPERSGFRRELRHYLEARIAFGEAPYDSVIIRATLVRADTAFGQVWHRVVRLSTDPRCDIATDKMVDSLNEMTVNAITRQASLRAHVPDAIVYMLFIIALTTAFFSGYVSANRGRFDWMAVITFYLMVTLVAYITLELDRPRRGIIRPTDVQEILVDQLRLFPPH